MFDGKRGTSLVRYTSLMTHYTSYSLAHVFRNRETIKKQHIIKPQTRCDRDYVSQLRILAVSASGNELLVPDGYKAS